MKQTNSENVTSLLVTLSNNNSNLTVYLDEQGSIINEKRNSKLIPLVFSTEKNNKDLLKYLEKRISASTNGDSPSPLQMDIDINQENLFKFMTKTKHNYSTTPSDINNSIPDFNNFLLHRNINIKNKQHASIQVNVKPIESRVKEDSLDNSKNSLNRKFSLHTTFDDNDQLMMNPLLNHGKVKKLNSNNDDSLLLWNYCNSISLPDLGGEKYQLHKAIKIGNEQLVEDLLKMLSHDKIDEEDNNGNTPLNLAIYHNNIPILKLLLEYGADVNKMGSNLFPPLYYAIAIKDNETMVDLLLMYGAHINKMTKDGDLPLHYAVKNEKENMVKLLLKYHVNVHQKDGKGHTPLYYAYYVNKNSKMVDLLIDHGASYDEVYKDKDFPYSYVIDNKKKGHVRKWSESFGKKVKSAVKQLK